MSATKSTAAAAANNMSSTNLMIVLILISVLTVGATVLVGKALVTDIIRDNKVRVKKLDASKNLDTNLANAPKLVAAYKGLGASTRLLDDALPTTTDFPAMIVTLENISADAGFNLRAVTPAVAPTVAAESGASGDASSNAGSTTAVAPAAYGVTVNYSGSYTALLKFNTDLEMSVRPMRIKGMQFTGSGSNLNGIIDLETYYQGKSGIPITKETIK